MNKNLKRIIAIALAFGTISAVAPATSVNLLTTKAYATTTTNADDTLDSLNLETSNSTTIRLYSDNDYDSDNKVSNDDVSRGDTYYAKTSSSTISIDTDGPSSSYVKVFKGTSSSTRGKSTNSDISLSSGTNTLVVRIYSSKPSTDIRYDDDDNVIGEYTVKVKCTSGSSTDEYDADEYDDIYLDKLSVDYENISLSESKIAYTYSVPYNVTEVTIKALPNDEDTDTVTIDGDEVNDSDSYKKKVSLSTGENKIQIEVENEDDDTDRVYTLNITRASATTTSTGTATTTPTTTTTVKASKWVQVYGKWQYNDATGNPIRNTLFVDKDYGQSYYLQADGNMATGWINVGGKWYFFGTDGAMKTGWQLVSGSWYYLDSQGVMAYNTKIDGYKLGANGAWIR